MRGALRILKIVVISFLSAFLGCASALAVNSEGLPESKNIEDIRGGQSPMKKTSVAEFDERVARLSYISLKMRSRLMIVTCKASNLRMRFGALRKLLKRAKPLSELHAKMKIVSEEAPKDLSADICGASFETYAKLLNEKSIVLNDLIFQFKENYKDAEEAAYWLERALQKDPRAKVPILAEDMECLESHFLAENELKLRLQDFIEAYKSALTEHRAFADQMGAAALVARERKCTDSDTPNSKE